MQATKTRQKIKVTVYSGESCNGDWPAEYDSKLVDVVKWFQRQLDDIPEQFRKNARCEISNEYSYDSSVATMKISYERPETDDEAAERVEAVKRRLKYARDSELETLRELQAKYGKDV